MAYSNEEATISSYDIVGEFAVNKLSIDENLHKLAVMTRGDRLFYAAQLEMDANGKVTGLTGYPNLTPNKSAFLVTEILGSGKPVGWFVAIVKDVHEYKIMPDGNVSLKFEYTVGNSRSVTMDTSPIKINPIIERILVVDSFIAIFFTGDEDAVLEHISQDFRRFTHGNKIYYTTGTATKIYSRLGRQEELDSMVVPIGYLLVGATTQIPDRKKLERFCKNAIYWALGDYKMIGGNVDE